MIRLLKHIIIASIGVFMSNVVFGQDVTVKADIDSSSIRVGEQTAIRLQVVKGAGTQLQMPLITDSLAEGLEIVAVAGPDTTELKEGSVQINETIVVTAFDSAVVTILPFVFVSGEDSFLTQPLTLKVTPIEVDSLRQGLYDIKGVYDPPINWWSVLRYALMILLLIIVAVGGYYLYKKYKQRKAVAQDIVEEPIDAYALAKERLAKIRAQKLWQTSDVKGFYTSLTDTLREYIEHRFGIDALEMTTEELIALMRQDGDARNHEEEIEMLDRMMRLADLTKFAKWIPTIEDGKNALDNADLFVEKTHESIIVETEKGGEA